MRNKILYAALLLAPIPAVAHVSLAEPEAKPGAHYTAQFMVGHGCGGSPTTMLAVTVPEGIKDVAPEPKPGWSVELHRDGGRVSQVVWKGGLIPADQKDSFSLTMVLPSQPGRLIFAADQTCQTGSESWSELPASDGHRLKNPAPILTVTDTSGRAAGQ
jgi:periplasmic copper chaperone A